MVQVKELLRCDNCHARGDAIIVMRNKKRYCFSCVRTKFWNLLRPGGYWRQLFNKPAFNKDNTKNLLVKKTN